MLPLWIIDLSQDTKTAALFETKLSGLTGPESIWYYSHISNDCSFRKDLVDEGQKFIHKLNTSKATRTGAFEVHVCVLGYASELLTQMQFADVAAILMEEKARILPHHTNYSMIITGMLFVPTEIYMKEANVCQRVVSLLGRLQEQRPDVSERGYQKMILWQDAQMATQKVYPMLSASQCIDYLIQVLVHLYYISDTQSSILDINDDFFVSLGVTAVFYDTSHQDACDRIDIVNHLISTFLMLPKIKEDYGSTKSDIPLETDLMKNLEELTPEKAIGRLVTDGSYSFTSYTPERSSLDPEEDFLNPDLIREYYEGYLSRYTYNLEQNYARIIDEDFNGLILGARKECVSMLQNFQNQIQDNIHSLLDDANANVGFLSRLESQFTNMEKVLTKKRKTFTNAFTYDFYHRMEHKFQEEIRAPFHRAWTTPSESNYKKVIENLNKLLSTTPTLLSFVCRTSILCVLSWSIFQSIPKVEDYAFFGMVLPIPVMFYIYRYTWKVLRHAEMEARAAMIYDNLEKVVHTLCEDIDRYYDKVLDITTDYLSRMKSIRERVKQLPQPVEESLLIPRSMFCQPVMDGRFADREILPGVKADFNTIRLDGRYKRLDHLDEKDWDMLTQRFCYTLYPLFDLTVPLNVQAFTHSLRKEIEAIIVPRENITVTARIMQYLQERNFKGSERLFEPIVLFAAINGNMADNTDCEYASVVLGDGTMQQYLSGHLPIGQRVQWHIVGNDGLCATHIFITRIRTMRNISINRILA